MLLSVKYNVNIDFENSKIVKFEYIARYFQIDRTEIISCHKKIIGSRKRKTSQTVIKNFQRTTFCRYLQKNSFELFLYGTLNGF